MKKTIILITKDILQKACVCFTCLVVVLNIISVPLASYSAGIHLNFHMTESWLTSGLIFMFLLASVLAGAAVQIHRITKIPAVSRHIVFFILNYGIFFVVVVPMSNHRVNQGTTFLLSFAFIIVYLIIFGIYMGIKSIINAARNKKLKYEEVYKSAK
ncbi:MAG: hypothetical protein FWH24_02605 [Oscillospiraceae bacterium]|nr:hypothetical protein [Oscillospiraceae bacterium]